MLFTKFGKYKSKQFIIFVFEKAMFSWSLPTIRKEINLLKLDFVDIKLIFRTLFFLLFSKFHRSVALLHCKWVVSYWLLEDSSNSVCHNFQNFRMLYFAYPHIRSHTEQGAAHMFYKLLHAASCFKNSWNGKIGNRIMLFFPTGSACCRKLRSLSNRIPRY